MAKSKLGEMSIIGEIGSSPLKALISEAERNGIEHLKHMWTGMRRYNETHFSYYNKNGTVVWATFPDLGFKMITTDCLINP